MRNGARDVGPSVIFCSLTFTESSQIDEKGHEPSFGDMAIDEKTCDSVVRRTCTNNTALNGAGCGRVVRILGNKTKNKKSA